MTGVNPNLIRVANRALEISSQKKKGCVDFSIPHLGGRRSPLQQIELYEARVSRCDGVDKRSPHQDGMALDVVPWVNGGVPWDDEFYFHRVAVCMLQAASELGVKLKWGGNWRSWTDLPHYEIL